ncbi:nucleotide sugar dehydrogenase [Iamia majanohamensis]|uniref:Nucleotide sugar dehydrogenase n=1 Tax=Iamia majanohamensis TaxID=467976 RepID=A0AAE9Y7I0_9ACTN|nr:nucleotide sugar dehydrogenase [Iamia majanohamensis]WCO65848.1 nucleotide sugar dehydrogenase [Iamia majanohamensis]
MATPGKLVVMGQGYVGLPLALRAVEVGYDVVGFEVDPRRVQELARGASYVEDVGDDRLQAALGSGRYHPTGDAARLADFDVAVITVPTPLRERLPDLSFVEAAADELGRAARPGCTVVLESTTYPGTTEEVVGSRIQERSGLRPGADFHLGYSPERIDPGNPTWTFERTPKVVSGVDARSLAAVEDLYGRLVERTVAVSGPKEAEMCKLLENTFRHVNIALVNELAMFADDLDVDIWEVIRAASTKPFGFLPFTPGPGVGGHCLPIDPSYLSWKVEQTLGTPFRFVELANDVNGHMPDYVVRRVNRVLNRHRRSINGSTIVLVGYAYKRNTGDARESPTVHLADLLLARGARVVAVDPHVDPGFLALHASEVAEDLSGVGEADGVVLLVDHDDIDLGPLDRAPWVLDTRGVLDGDHVERL